jgi:protein-tyrosine-phosphatase
VQFLFLCTANLCRSPIAAAFLARWIDHVPDPVVVSSAGVTRTDGSVPTELIDVMSEYGIDLSGHRKRRVTQELLAGSDLIIGMGPRHIREAVLIDPPCWPQAFTIRELVRRGAEVGPRRPDQGIRSWIESAQGDRTRESLLFPSPKDEVRDPYGGTVERYRGTATELADLTRQLSDLVWPD